LNAKGDVAQKAYNLLAPLCGQVVRLFHTSHSDFQGQSELKLMDQFEVEVVSVAPRELAQQAVKRITLDKLSEATDKSKVSFLSCMINTTSESKVDKNGKPYRNTRMVDARGAVVKMMVWGDIAGKDAVWLKGSVVDITAASVNRVDERIELRNYSMIDCSSNASSFRLQSRLHFVKWS
jgi:hypothetical protein